MSNSTDLNQPILILIRGLPGSGKTFIAQALQAKLHEEYRTDAVIMLDPDATDYDSQAYKDHSAAQLAEGVDAKLLPYRFLRSQAQAGIAADKIIIWNQPFTNIEIFNKMVAKLESHATEHQKTLSILVVEVEIDPEMAKHRVDKRKSEGGHGPSDNTFTRFVHDYESFNKYGYNTVTVQGTSQIADSIAAIQAALDKI